MKVCEKKDCLKEHNNKGRFCSRSCANSRSWSEDDKLRKSIAAKSSEKVKNSIKTLQGRTISQETKDKLQLFWQEKKKKNVEVLLKVSWDELGFDRKRKRVLIEQGNKCASCQLDTWLGQKLSLEIDHKDGNRTNNSRDNLEALCPNCHSLTTTWRGRNKQVKRGKISDEVYLETLIKNNWNMRQSLLELGLSPKGGNYKKCHSFKKLFFQLVL